MRTITVMDKDFRESGYGSVVQFITRTGQISEDERVYLEVYDTRCRCTRVLATKIDNEQLGGIP